jgi:hypothetical protein
MTSTVRLNATAAISTSYSVASRAGPKRASFIAAT